MKSALGSKHVNTAIERANTSNLHTLSLILTGEGDLFRLLALAQVEELNVECERLSGAGKAD
jgi:hypothetical protein